MNPIRWTEEDPTPSGHARILARRGFKGDAARFPDRLVCLKEMGWHAAAGKALPRGRLALWAEHPNERVVSYAVRAFSSLLAKKRSLLSAVQQRALSDARREKKLWTPLLDVLALSGLWGEQDGASSFAEEALKERIEAIVPFIGSFSEEECKGILLRIRYPALVEEVVRHAPVLPNAVLYSIIIGHGLASALPGSRAAIEGGIDWRAAFYPASTHHQTEGEVEELAVHNLWKIFDTLRGHPPEIFMAVLEGASYQAPEEVLRRITDGLIRHPAIEPRALLVPLLSSSEERHRLLAIRSLPQVRSLASRRKVGSSHFRSSTIPRGAGVARAVSSG